MNIERISGVGRRRLAHDIREILPIGLPMNYGSQSGSLAEGTTKEKTTTRT